MEKLRFGAHPRGVRRAEVRLCTVLPTSRGRALRGKTDRCSGAAILRTRATPPTNCAERTALFKAVSEGVREFDAIAIVGSKVGETNTLVTGPCGVCRQALYEFGGPELTVIMARSEDDYIVATSATCCPTASARQIWSKITFFGSP